MIEKVDDDGRRVERSLDVVDRGHIFQPLPLGIRPDFAVQPLPVGAYLAIVDVAVKGQELGMLFCDIPHDDRLERAAQIEVFQPYEIALVPRPLDYPLGMPASWKAFIAANLRSMDARQE